MKFNEEEIDYLDGKKFSNGYKFNVAKKNEENIDRFNFLEKYVENKSVLHIGFADHTPLIKEKIKNNKWLHKRLVDKARLCVGIDINSEAVEYIKSEINIKNVYSFDILKDKLPIEIIGLNWDIVILGEVLEHIDNPVEFLTNIHSKLANNANELIVTVPNALELINLKLIRKGQEFINTDHRFWFTPFTLSKVLLRAGFITKEFFYSQTFMPNRLLDKYLIKRFPMLRETVISISLFKS